MHTEKIKFFFIIKNWLNCNLFIVKLIFFYVNEQKRSCISWIKFLSLFFFLESFQRDSLLYFLLCIYSYKRISFCKSYSESYLIYNLNRSYFVFFDDNSNMIIDSFDILVDHFYFLRVSPLIAVYKDFF